MKKIRIKSLWKVLGGDSPQCGEMSRSDRGDRLRQRNLFSWEKNKQTNKQINKQNPPQNLCLTVTASGEVAQTLASATSGQGPGREVRIVSSVLRVRTGLTALRKI